MPLKQEAEIEVTAFRWVPQGAQGLVKDLRVRWALEEAGLDYRVRLIGPERPPRYLEDQPFNQVPCFRDERVQIFESGAILQYIGEKTELLLPRQTQARIRAVQWTYAAANSIEPFVQHRVLLDVIFADEEWATQSKPTMDQLARLRLQQLSGWLTGRLWLEDDRFTIGDLMMVTVLRIADRGGLLSDFPILSDYVRRGQERAAFKQALGDQLAVYTANPPHLEGAAA
ncbi:MAG TPA: glutathione S-transferase family protein [Sphingomicrobium sp.]|nr:glutathione S-transferase family protein [Sphingomicrobium sp.]